MGQSMSTDFETFNKLPSELRLMIWEEALPKIKDDHAAYKIFRSTPFHGLRWERPKNADGPLPLLQASGESHAVAMKSGSYMTVKNKRFRMVLERFRGLFEKRYHLVWVEKSHTTLHVPFAALTCKRVTNLPSNIHAVASTMPTQRGLEALQRCLTQDREYMGIKTVYIGIVGIPIHYSKGDDPDYYPCTESDSAIVPLDDEKLTTYLATAYKAHAFRGIGDPVLREEEIYRKNALRFKNSLEKDWEDYQHLRSLWEPYNGISLVPAVIFGTKTKKVVSWSSDLYESIVVKLKLGHLEAQADLVWMDAFAYENGIGNENNLDELTFQTECRTLAHRVKSVISPRDAVFTPRL